MEKLWAPWRKEYIQSAENQEESNRCFLCEAVDLGVSPQSLVVYLDSLWVIILNRYPYNNGHLMVAPRRHIGELEDLNPNELTSIGDLTRRAVRWLKNAYTPQGYNIGMNIGRVAGAGLEGHLHLHIVPRWNGDTNYMPLIADTKVVSEGLIESWQRIRKTIESEEKL